MRVAFVYDALYPDTKGGVERRVWELARQLRSAGHSVDLLVPQFWDGDPVIERDGVTIRGVCPARPLYRDSGRRALLPSLRHAFGVYRTLRRRRYDVVDCQIPAHPAAIVSALARRRDPETRLVITWHEAWGPHWIEEFGAIGHLGRAVERRVAGLEAVHVSVSNDVSASLQRIGAASAAIIEGGVDLETLEKVEGRPEADICFIGRLVPSKNLDLLLRSMRVLADQQIRPRLVIIGDGPGRVESRALADSLGIADSVIFKGTVPEWETVVALLKGSSVLAMPSVREGFGLVALEAMACGVPVVTVDHPRNAARSIVERWDAGVVVDPTPESFAAGLRSQLESSAGVGSMPVGSERLSNAGWHHAARVTATVYEGVAA